MKSNSSGRRLRYSKLFNCRHHANPRIQHLTAYDDFILAFALETKFNPSVRKTYSVDRTYSRSSNDLTENCFHTRGPEEKLFYVQYCSLLFYVAYDQTLYVR
ncbi:hypothetical protein ABKN59_010703 [Abortiporus biennis]